MNRLLKERKYWGKAALDPNVDKKYMCDQPNKKFFDILGDLDGKVLEIGCGVGRLLKKGYYGIDISEQMLFFARKRKKGRILKRCDGRTIPFKDNFFDSVFCVLLFQHLPFEGVKSYLKETARVLKSGGKFIFQFIEGTEKEPFSYHHSLIDISEVLEKNKLEIIGISKQYIHESWTWVFTKKETIKYGI